ncbi:hypothetical protein H312_01478 [Anncaliia algerae PRA339]|uniref:Uncharacterized protein n=1 Tax=Anncaliia algerae PRA339 TaxID=1288291 RepID=A0A059F201_9MICR|nr:hypothetical protein H312_01478 [Anncaliia algerae PRA339]
MYSFPIILSMILINFTSYRCSTLTSKNKSVKKCRNKFNFYNRIKSFSKVNVHKYLELGFSMELYFFYFDLTYKEIDFYKNYKSKEIISNLDDHLKIVRRKYKSFGKDKRIKREEKIRFVCTWFDKIVNKRKKTNIEKIVCEVLKLLPTEMTLNFFFYTYHTKTNIKKAFKKSLTNNT